MLDPYDKKLLKRIFIIYLDLNPNSKKELQKLWVKITQ